MISKFHFVFQKLIVYSIVVLNILNFILETWREIHKIKQIFEFAKNNDKINKTAFYCLEQFIIKIINTPEILYTVKFLIGFIEINSTNIKARLARVFNSLYLL